MSVVYHCKKCDRDLVPVLAKARNVKRLGGKKISNGDIYNVSNTMVCPVCGKTVDLEKTIVLESV